jgi:hypothetical protein
MPHVSLTDPNARVKSAAPPADETASKNPAVSRQWGEVPRRENNPCGGPRDTACMSIGQSFQSAVRSSGRVLNSETELSMIHSNPAAFTLNWSINGTPGSVAAKFKSAGSRSPYPTANTLLASKKSQPVFRARLLSALANVQERVANRSAVSRSSRIVQT